MRYITDELTLLYELFPTDEAWLMEEDYPVFWQGIYDWVPPIEEDALCDQSA